MTALENGTALGPAGGPDPARKAPTGLVTASGDVTALRWTAEDAEGRRQHDLLSEVVDPEDATLSLFRDDDDAAPWSLELLVLRGRDPAVFVDLVASLTDVAPGAITVEPVQDADWVARSQRFLAPVRAGRFLIHGSHDSDLARRRGGRWAIEIDAAQAFGTAHHATTVGCLLAIDALTRTTAIETAADIGTGTGILAIALGRAASGCEIVAGDVDPVAVGIARENAVRNGVPGVTFVTSLGFDHPGLKGGAVFDLVLANILAAPLVRLAPAMAARVGLGGHLVLSGILARQAPGVEARYRAHGFRMERRIVREGWATLLLTRSGD